jgi:uncharacterized membrane protein YhiD involved in acid resistance
MDIMYIFWAITIGIANGVAYIKVSLTTTIIISIVMFLMTKRTLSSKNVYLLIVKHNTKNKNNIVNIVESNFKKSQIKSQTMKNGNYESIFEVRGCSNQAINLLEQIDNIETSLISYENNV